MSLASWIASIDECKFSFKTREMTLYPSGYSVISLVAQIFFKKVKNF